MRQIIFLLMLLPAYAYAGNDEFECSHHNGVVECKAAQDGVSVSSITINGGECSSPVHPKIHHKVMMKGDKFIVPGSRECNYVATLTIQSHSGKIQRFNAM